MDKTFFDELCKQEAQLVEQLRILREFKNTFFSLSEPVQQLATTSEEKPKPFQQRLFEAKKSAKKTYKKRNALTVPAMVLNSLDEIDTGSTQDIANKLVKLYPSVSPEKALKDTKHHVSLLSKAGKIKIIEKRPGKLGFTYQSVNSLL